MSRAAQTTLRNLAGNGTFNPLTCSTFDAIYLRLNSTRQQTSAGLE